MYVGTFLGICYYLLNYNSLQYSLHRLWTMYFLTRGINFLCGIFSIWSPLWRRLYCAKRLMKAKTRQRKDGIMALHLRPLKKSLNPNAKFLQNVFFSISQLHHWLVFLSGALLISCRLLLLKKSCYRFVFCCLSRKEFTFTA